MTKIILKPSGPVIPVKVFAPDEISSNKFYGIKIVDENRRGFVRAMRYKEGYNLHVLSGFTHDNKCGFNFATLEEAIEGFLARDMEVYEFDKLSELAAWLEE